MALPPEHINIKRRRVEEPVETLYIQSELHHNKRRFTDFVFHRVQVADNQSNEPSRNHQLPVNSALGQNTQSSRSVSSSGFITSTSTPGTAAQVPLVRATSPGAEFREARRLPAPRKELDIAPSHTQYSPATTSDHRVSGAGRLSSLPGGRATFASSPNRVGPLRRFHISRPHTSAGFLRATSGGVQKKRDGTPVRAVLVEKISRTPASQHHSTLKDHTQKTDDTIAGVKIQKHPMKPQDTAEELIPRRRPIINKAEKRWRELQKDSIATSKAHIASIYDKQPDFNPEAKQDDSERLVQEFTNIALELNQEGKEMKSIDPSQLAEPFTCQKTPPRLPSKYQPKSQPLRLREATSYVHHGRKPIGVRDDLVHGSQNTMNLHPALDYGSTQQDYDSDGDADYVYDTYVRQPLPPHPMLTDPLGDMGAHGDAWYWSNGIDAARTDIGVVVITEDDEKVWELFAEDEDGEDKWNSEDEDSNAEDNPANDYPEEELSSADEFDDPFAIYTKYRHGSSGDEGFDVDETDSEGDGISRSRLEDWHDMSE